MMYSRPSGAKPPRPLNRSSCRRGSAASATSGRCVLCGRKRGGRGSLGSRWSSCSASSPRVRDDRARNRLEKYAILGGDLRSRAHEDAAGSIDEARPDPRGDQPHYLILQLLPITGVIFVPDHQIDLQPLETPVGMRLDHLAHEIDIGPVGNLQQDDRQFRLTPVRLGPDMEGKRAVLSGLKPEQPILVEGAFHLNNERKRKELE